MLLEKEKKVMGYFSQHEVGLCTRPFLKAARDLSMAESELVDLLSGLQKKGIIKHLRGLINHVNAGYWQNALIAWKSGCGNKKKEEELVKDVFLAEPRITHCYKRKAHKAFSYNLYIMMHARNRKDILEFVKRNARRFNLEQEILFTERELKKEKLNLREILC